ncbi:MAG: TetR family transcriptional regulator C-terminal domain-containing protein [Cyclobacteriaceae bacterium]
MQKQKIIQSYLDYILDKQERPSSVFHFAKSLKIEESEFYNHFNSFSKLENELWKGYFDTTIERMEADEAYAGFSARQKFLSFLYTWIEELKNNRSYALFIQKSKKPHEVEPAVFKEFKSAFIEFAKSITSEGRSAQELAERPFLSEQYHKTLWWQVLFIFKFWTSDESDVFEKTDAAIEKAVNLAFDLMSRNAVDSFFDLAKFLVQSK